MTVPSCSRSAAHIPCLPINRSPWHTRCSLQVISLLKTLYSHFFLQIHEDLIALCDRQWSAVLKVDNSSETLVQHYSLRFCGKTVEELERFFDNLHFLSSSDKISLNLSYMSMEPSQLHRILSENDEVLDQVRSLTIRICGGIGRWMQCLEMLESLSMLSFSTSQLDREDITKLAGSNIFSGLIALDLSYCCIGDRAVHQLAMKANLSHLRGLNLSFNQISDQSVSTLIRQDLGNLKSLVLVGNNIKDGGARAIAQSTLGNLDLLNLSFCDLGAEGAHEIISSTKRQIQVLNLRDTKIDHTAVINLRMLASQSDCFVDRLLIGSTNSDRNWSNL